MLKELLDFQAEITEVEQINPLFSTCKVRVLYTGKNRNNSIITRGAVEKALPTLKNIPIVGEFLMDSNDFSGHGGSIDLDSLGYIHTTKPYGVVPESATYSWEKVNGVEYLTIDGCYLWTGRYEEANEVILNGKGQSMEIEVTDGIWIEEENAYQIDNFVFSALCILGDDVEPAFEGASITAYSLDEDSFRREFTSMLSELKTSLTKDEEEDKMLEELLEKYSLTLEDLTAKEIDAKEYSVEELEEKIIEVFGKLEEEGAIKEDFEEEKEELKEEIEKLKEEIAKLKEELEEEKNFEGNGDAGDEGESGEGDDVTKEELEEQLTKLEEEFTETKDALEGANATIEALEEGLQDLRDYKLNAENEKQEVEAQKIFDKFQLDEYDVKDINIYNLTLEVIEEKCYTILGKKLAKKNFSKDGPGIRLPINDQVDSKSKDESPYGGLFERYKK